MLQEEKMPLFPQTIPLMTAGLPWTKTAHLYLWDSMERQAKRRKKFFWKRHKKKRKIKYKTTEK